MTASSTSSPDRELDFRSRPVIVRGLVVRVVLHFPEGPGPGSPLKGTYLASTILIMPLIENRLG